MQIAEAFLCSCCLQQWRVLRGDVALARLQLSRGPQLETELHNPPSVGSSPHTATQQAPRLSLLRMFSCNFFCGPLFEINGVACNLKCRWTLGWERCPWCWPSVIHDWLIESLERWHYIKWCYSCHQYSPIMQTKWKSENNDYQIDTNHALCTLPAQSVWQSLIKSGHQQSTPPP